MHDSDVNIQFQLIPFAAQQGFSRNFEQHMNIFILSMEIIEFKFNKLM